MRKVTVIKLLLIMFTEIFLLCSCSPVICNHKKQISSWECQQDAIEYEKGILEVSSWKNQYLGVRFVPCDEYILATQYELDSLIDTKINSVLTGEDSSKLEYAKKITVYEMTASASWGIPNVSVTVERLPNESISEEQYAETLKKQLSGLDSSGLIYKIIGTSRESVGNKEFMTLNTAVEYSDNFLNQDYLIRKYNGYMMSIIITYSDNMLDKREELLNCFYEY